jgi:hypothetical protein
MGYAMLSQITPPRRLEDVDRVDLEACVLLREWGVSYDTVVFVKPRRASGSTAGREPYRGVYGLHVVWAVDAERRSCGTS